MYTKEMVIACHLNVWIWTVQEINMFVIIASSLVPFFWFEGYNTCAWSLEVVQKFWSFFSQHSIFISGVESVDNFLLQSVLLLPLFFLDIHSSLLQPIDYFRVVVGKCDLSTFDLIALFISKVWHVRKSFFDLELAVKFELSHFAHWIALLKILSFPVIILFMGNVKFNRVVTGSQSFDIIVKLVGWLDWLDIVNENHGIEVDEYSCTGKVKAIDLSLTDFEIQFTSVLNEEHSIFSTNIWHCLTGFENGIISIRIG